LREVNRAGSLNPGAIGLQTIMPAFGTRTLIVVIAIVAVACGVLLPPMVQSAREVARGMSCRNNLRQIGLALLNYESTYHSLPIAVETDSAGRLWRSWRSQIYPVYMESSSMFYDVKSSWDSSSNMRLLNGSPITMGRKDGTTYMATLSRYPWAFSCPSCESGIRNGINYVVVSGHLTAFPKSTSVKLSEIKDGLENTILVVESITCCPDWTEPRDLEFDTMSYTINARNKPSISSLHPRGPLVCFADGAVYHISENATETELKAMLTIVGNEDIRRQDLIDRKILLE
jgi:hypothetical protein